MSGLRGVLVATAMLWLAAVLEQGVAQRLSIFGCPPNFLLAVLAPMALVSRPSVGGTIGFFAGLLQGGLAGANLTHYVISRALTGFFTSLGGLLDIRIALLVAGLLCASATLVAQLILMFLAPPPGGNLVSFLLQSIGTAVYNGVIGMPVYALLRRWFKEDRSTIVS